MSDFKYGLVYRPPGLGAVPKGYTHYDPSNQGIDGVRHGVLTYDHELTPKEVKDFELKPLFGNGDIHKVPGAVQRKTKEAIEQLNYIAEEKIEREDAPEAYEDAEKVLDIFRNYAKSKGLDANECLKAMGLNARFIVKSSTTAASAHITLKRAEDLSTPNTPWLVTYPNGTQKRFSNRAGAVRKLSDEGYTWTNDWEDVLTFVPKPKRMGLAKCVSKIMERLSF